MPRPALAELDSGPAVNWLFLDLNAYFASVEQQERPELRGRPVAVVPLVTPNTVCIAAGYEAKPFGVKTGVKVKEAQRLCPELALVEARPQLYVQYHHALLAAVETCLPVTTVMSIDEAACRLLGQERWLPNALKLAQAVKQAVRGVGETLRCSVGLAPSRYLAKVASDMQKPDGLTALLAEDLPQALYRLQLGDLPGIGPRTDARLRARGLASVEQLCSLTRPQLRQAWGSVWGERLWDWLRGLDYEEPATVRKSLGRQHVLAPELRTPERAFTVAQKLLHEAAAEMRRQDLWAGGLGLAVNFLDERGQRSTGPWVNHPSWKTEARFEDCRDIFTLQAHLRRLWEACPPRPPILVYVWLFVLANEQTRTPTLFPAEADPQARATAAATAAMDALNQRFGSNTVYPGSLHTVRDAAPRRIAFKHVPKLEEW